MTATSTVASVEHAIGAAGLFSLRLRDGDLRIRAVDGETIRISETHGHDLSEMFVIELGEGSASLRSTHGTTVLGIRRHGHAPDLAVDLPRGATIVVESTSAGVRADGLLGDQRYRTVSGDLTLSAVSGRIAIEAVSGDVKVSAIGETDVALRTVSGDVELRAGTLRSLRSTTTSGDLKVAGRLLGPGPFSVETVSGDALIAPAGEVRIEMTTMSGDLRSDVDGRAAGGRGQRSLSIGTGGPLLTFRSMSGDLRVVRPTRIDMPDVPAPTALPALPAPAAPAVMVDDDPRLPILRALERGEIDVAEAGRRLEVLDDVSSVDPASDTTRTPVARRTDA